MQRLPSLAARFPILKDYCQDNGRQNDPAKHGSPFQIRLVHVHPQLHSLLSGKFTSYFIRHIPCLIHEVICG